MRARPGLPLYESVKEAMIAAIDRGDFQPAEKLPSTKQLSQQFEVSLVTAHRALQELESTGLISRVQGRGTFVSADPHIKRGQRRISVGLRKGLSLADFYHSRLLEGISTAVSDAGAELSIVPASDVPPDGFDGHLVINPSDEQQQALQQSAKARSAVVVIGVAELPGVTCVDIDNADLMQRAVRHLAGLGHQRIAYLGGAGDMAYRRTRRQSYRDALAEHALPADDRMVVLTEGWKLNDADKASLMRCLTLSPPPTALVAAGYYYALGAYETVSTLGIGIPEQLSVVAVDDPPSAAHLNPPLTTLRQPVEQIGHTAVHRLMQLIDRRDTGAARSAENGTGSPGNAGIPGSPAASAGIARVNLLRGELIVRDSTIPARR